MYVWERHQSVINLKTFLQLGEKIWIALDGGVTDGLGYYAWVIAMDSFILWEGYGHSEGVPEVMESLRAKSSGLLATLHFLLCFLAYHNISILENLPSHYCDNSGLVGCIKAVANAYVHTPTQCLKPDWDLQMAIEATVKQLRIDIKQHHVYGCQDMWSRGNSMKDKETRKEHLPTEKESAPNKKRQKQKKLHWEARLNIGANALATQAYHVLCKRKKHKATFHPLPAAKIYLQIQDTFVLCRHSDAINAAWCYKDTEKHLIQRYTWSKNTMAGIDFNTPRAIYKNSTVSYKRFLT
eukprot:12374285-Ditylum_brightwellii.AAC.1